MLWRSLFLQYTYSKMKETTHKILIKNMVCPRCISSVKTIFDQLKIPVVKIEMGEVSIPGKLNKEQSDDLERALKQVGFELIESRVNKIIEDIKKLCIDYLNLGMDNENLKLSSFITKHLNYDYSYLSDLFSSIEGKTIEQYFIQQRIEKVKELLVYDQLSLTEISYQTGFSSVHHLSAQFKKVTGLTPSYFKKIGIEKRKSLDSI